MEKLNDSNIFLFLKKNSDFKQKLNTIKEFFMLPPSASFITQKCQKNGKVSLILWFIIKTIFIDNQVRMLNFPPKAGVKILDIQTFNENEGILTITFLSSHLLKFPQQNFLHTSKKNPIWLTPFKPDLFYVKNIEKIEKITWVFKNKRVPLTSLVS